MTDKSVLIYQLRDKYGNRYSDLIPDKSIAVDIPIRGRKKKRKYRPKSKHFERQYGPIVSGQCKRFTCDNPAGIFSPWYCSETCFHWDYPTQDKHRLMLILRRRNITLPTPPNMTKLDRPTCHLCHNLRLMRIEKKPYAIWLCFSCHKYDIDTSFSDGWKPNLSPTDATPYRRY